MPCMDDLFGDIPQPDPAPPPPERAPLTADDVREKMLDILAALRASEAMPFAPDELRSHKAMFPIMAQWLDPSEGDALVRSFTAEVLRLTEAA